LFLIKSVKLLYKFNVHKELIQGIVGAQSLHADNLSTMDLSVKLEAHSHFAALAEGAILAQKNGVEDLLDLVKGDLESHSFGF
jgi:hypothetical protein